MFHQGLAACRRQIIGPHIINHPNRKAPPMPGTGHRSEAVGSKALPAHRPLLGSRAMEQLRPPTEPTIRLGPRLAYSLCISSFDRSGGLLELPIPLAATCVLPPPVEIAKIDPARPRPASPGPLPRLLHQHRILGGPRGPVPGSVARPSKIP